MPTGPPASASTAPRTHDGLRRDVAVAQPPPGAETFRSLALRGRRVSTVPNQWEWVVLDAIPPPYEDVLEAYRDLQREAGDQPVHRAFGWPDLVQTGMQRDCQLRSHGISRHDPEARKHYGWGPKSRRITELEAGAADWRLLWQVDTDLDAGWQWGDVGTLYYWIRRQDPAAGAFERAWAIVQSH